MVDTSDEDVTRLLAWLLYHKSIASPKFIFSSNQAAAFDQKLKFLTL